MSTREQIILVRRSENPKPYVQYITKQETFYRLENAPKGTRKQLLAHARLLGKDCRV